MWHWRRRVSIRPAAEAKDVTGTCLLGDRSAAREAPGDRARRLSGEQMPDTGQQVFGADLRAATESAMMSP
jgi:hypothetical protein